MKGVEFAYLKGCWLNIALAAPTIAGQHIVEIEF